MIAWSINKSFGQLLVLVRSDLRKAHRAFVTDASCGYAQTPMRPRTSNIDCQWQGFVYVLELPSEPVRIVTVLVLGTKVQHCLCQSVLELVSDETNYGSFSVDRNRREKSERCN